jgi:hypothetical protein
VRPSLRALGSLLTIGLTLLFISKAMRLFPHPGPIVEQCSRGKGRLICELEGWLLSFLPAAVHGPLLAIGSLLMAGIWLIATWLLLRPLLVRNSGEASAPRSRRRHHDE